ncbi:MAG TPA: hypothetical protein VGQ31_10795 [Candidatus Limnocylindrales bacterium]|nr:hypothetical protein [Candidatus Limnocylindrales bacterium]
MAARAALIATVLLVAGCSAAAAPSGGVPTATPTVGASALTPEDGSQSPGTILLPASVIDPVVADIARTAGVPVDQVEVISAQPVTFPDGSLGCPQPGLAYTQVLVDGYQIVARAGDATYDYRGSGSTFKRCTPAAS